MTQRESLEMDVLIVGAGPSGLATALRLSQLIEQHNKEIDAGTRQGEKLSTEEIYLLEKGKEIGSHLLSGAVLDPRSILELCPEFASADSGARAFSTPVTADGVYFLTETGQFKTPIVPPFFQNHGNYIVSINRLARWLGEKVESSGVSVFTGFSGEKLIFEDGRVAGVQTDDKGLDKEGKQKSNFEPGYELRAKVTVLAEGTRGSLAKQLTAAKKLDAGKNPQVWAVGVKELWEVPLGRVEPGTVIHTAGWPLAMSQFGGGWLYAMPEGRVSLGLVSGLDYSDPRFDPHEAFQRYKTHPLIRRILEGGKMIKYGAKTVPEGGWWAMPKLVTDGALIVGDSGGFLNSQRLKGIHLAIKSGMLAAEAIFEALKKGDLSESALESYERSVESSWAKEELWKVRNHHQAFEGGFLLGSVHVGLQMITGGRGIQDRYPNRAGHEHMHRLDGAAAAPKFVPDGKLTFDKLTDVYFSATKHGEDQPCHLVVADTNICNGRCVEEYGNPCQHFCPAAVYEMVEEKGGGKKLHINASNCVHCKTCDIMDPYQIIDWVPPEGGGGPSYDNM